MRTALGFWLFLCLCGESYVLGQTSRPQDSALVEALVNQLQSEKFEDRDQASAAIFEIGAEARPWIEKGSKSSSLELRLRCETLLAQIDRADFDRQLEDFRVGRNLEILNRLPCSKEFRLLFGSTDSARTLYCDAVMSDRALLLGLEGFLQTAREVNDSLPEPERRARLSQKARPIQYLLNETVSSEIEPSVAERLAGEPLSSWTGFRAETLAVCILIASQKELETEKSIQSLVYGFFQESSLRKVRKSKHLAALRIGAAQWLSQAGVKPQALSIAMRLGLAEVALKLGRGAVDSYSVSKAGDLDHDGRDDLVQAAMGIVACGKFGDDSDIGRLEKLLKEEVIIRTWITEDQETYTCQLRDLALAYSAHLAGVDARAIGFPHIEENAELVFAPYSLTFIDDTQREKAHSNWRRLRAKAQKETAPPVPKSA